jgi:hypothetical protein
VTAVFVSQRLTLIQINSSISLLDVDIACRVGTSVYQRCQHTKVTVLHSCGTTSNHDLNAELEEALDLNKALQGCDVGRAKKPDLCMIMGNLPGN